ncbi:uncharacterized protein LOC120617497 [Pteropus medius]|uniref:uncharacterized protein LOC120617497 n=1 Tax=Pteropus vampyrus TaxID=132908 RepID=UPI00196B0439|nr:uncharacterized protein LOC120617497 [Pteropus giganteus]
MAPPGPATQPAPGCFPSPYPVLTPQAWPLPQLGPHHRHSEDGESVAHLGVGRKGDFRPSPQDQQEPGLWAAGRVAAQEPPVLAHPANPAPSWKQLSVLGQDRSGGGKVGLGGEPFRLSPRRPATPWPVPCQRTTCHVALAAGWLAAGRLLGSSAEVGIVPAASSCGQIGSTHNPGPPPPPSEAARDESPAVRTSDARSGPASDLSPCLTSLPFWQETGGYTPLPPSSTGKSTLIFEASSPGMCLPGPIEHSEFFLFEATENRVGGILPLGPRASTPTRFPTRNGVGNRQLVRHGHQQRHQSPVFPPRSPAPAGLLVMACPVGTASQPGLSLSELL